MRRHALAALVAATVVTACGEPAVDLDVPARDEARVLDVADLLDGAALTERLEALTARTGLDSVAVAYETDQASAGEARRAGQLVAEEWDADLVLVAVAEPGDFASLATEPGPDQRRRFFGVEPADTFAVPGSLREDVAEVLVPPIAARNDWDAAFAAAVDGLSTGLTSGEEAS